MIELGWILYVLLAALLFLFWRKTRGLSFDDLLDRSARDHHHVQRVIAKHPHGGAWQEHQRWMQEHEVEKRRKRVKKRASA